MYSQVGIGEGGAETAFKRVAQGLESRGHTVARVFQTCDQSVGKYRSQDGKYFIKLPFPNSGRGFLDLSIPCKFIKSLLSLSCILRTVNPDVVNCHFLTSNSIYFAILKSIFQYRFVVSCHGSDVTKMQANNRRTAPFILSRADSVTCVSKALAEKLKQKVSMKSNATVIHNGINVQSWHQVDSKRKVGSAKNIVTVGSLKRVKGHDVLIKAFNKIYRIDPEARLIIIGDGPNRTAYEELAEQLGVDDRVRFTGWLSTERIQEEFARSLLFVFPSRREGFGIALLEAMAAGLPVVASKTGGIPEIVEGTETLLVPPESPSDLAEQINTALTDPSWRNRARCSVMERAREFSWECTMRQYEQCLVDT
jgi:glycosyltransferase involved in cell wall biosynthesis